MSKPLTIPETLELLDGLRAVLRDFAAREEKLNLDHRLKSEAIQKQFKTAWEEEEARLAEAISQAEAAADAQRTALQHRHSERGSWIRRAHRPSKTQVLRHIDDRESYRKGELQKTLRDATRDREQGLAANDAALADYNQRLNDNRQEFVALEQVVARAFGGISKFKSLLAEAAQKPESEFAPDEHQLLEELRKLHMLAGEDLGRFQKFFIPKFFRIFPLWVQVIVLGGLGGGLHPLLQYFKVQSVPDPRIFWGGAGALFIGTLVLYFKARGQGLSLAGKLAEALEKARRMHNACLAKSQARHAQEIERLETNYKNTTEEVDRQWKANLAEAVEMREFWPKQIDEKLSRIYARHDRLYQARGEQIGRERAATLERLRQASGQCQAATTANRNERLDKLQAETQAIWQALAVEWKQRLEPAYAAIQAANEFAAAESPEWDPKNWTDWKPPSAARNLVRFGRLEVDVAKYAEAATQDKRLALPGPAQVSLPLWLKYPQQGSIVFETNKVGGEEAVAAINNILFRLLATTPAGKLSFTIIDPVKLGQNFAGIMHLADYEENLINGRIWTQANQIEEHLKDLTEHMEKVIQMYLRNEYETIAEYNIQAGNIAEKYHFVVVADFPMNFSDAAARRLLHIASSGARCGVFTLIHWDHRFSAPADFAPDILRKTSVRIQRPGDVFTLGNLTGWGARLRLDQPPHPDFATEFLHHVGEVSRGSNRVEVPFAQVSPAPEEVWSEETTEELRVPIGRSGATKLQYLSIGKGTRQHALVAGKTGSGKSTLFHVIITNLAQWCSPEQVEFYLVDFKKGVEFKCYAAARLPHARVVAIESDREFGLSVLQRLDDELRRRGDVFRQHGVQDVAGYKRAGGAEAMPRCLLLIDEFQEFFVEDDRISQAAAVLMDRIVRQGRAFGIHVILGSQTLGGAYTLARTTMGQMVIRIALQCNEADAYLIMDENNSAPRLLSRPGEGIYNDNAGAVEGNSPFQTVWLTDEERDAVLYKARDRADRELPAYTGPVVFEGNAPANVDDNHTLRKLLEAPAVQPGPLTRIWLGAPNSIKGPTEAVFQRRSGNNLLVVGQRDEAILGLVSLSLISLSAQYPKGAARFVLFDASVPGTPPSEFLERVAPLIPHELTLGRGGDLGSLMNTLGDELKARSENEQGGAPEIFVVIHGLQNFKKFRQDDDFGFGSSDSDSGANAAAQLGKLITDGASHGIHVIATVDTYNNVNRYLGRKALGEFEMRVLFQMSTNDSASLCDDPQASNLGLHCALFYNEQEGYLEKFRPYSLASNEWLEMAGKNLQRLVPGA